MMQDVGKFMNHQGHLPAYAVHHCELGDLWVFAGAAAIVSAIARYLGKSGRTRWIGRCGGFRWRSMCM
jgi:hypothetical protein